MDNSSNSNGRKKWQVDGEGRLVPPLTFGNVSDRPADHGDNAEYPETDDAAADDGYRDGPLVITDSDKRRTVKGKQIVTKLDLDDVEIARLIGFIDTRDVKLQIVFAPHCVLYVRIANLDFALKTGDTEEVTSFKNGLRITPLLASDGEEVTGCEIASTKCPGYSLRLNAEEIDIILRTADETAYLMSQSIRPTDAIANFRAHRRSYEPD